MPIRILIPSALMLAWLALAVPVLADCEPAGPIDRALSEAQVAFVGTVVAVDGPVATFTVQEVWAGEVDDTVDVRGSFDELGGPNAGFGAGFSEDDRQWTLGITYLVLPWVADGVLRDHICTATTEWTSELASLRPAGVRVATPPEPSAGVPTPILVLLVTVAVVAAASVLAFRRH
jgi:hypothetical protein